MARWSVTANGHGTQAPQTFREAVDAVVFAAEQGFEWDVEVRGPRDPSYRYLTDQEASMLIGAVTERMETA